MNDLQRQGAGLDACVVKPQNDVSRLASSNKDKLAELENVSWLDDVQDEEFSLAVYGHLVNLY